MTETSTFVATKPAKSTKTRNETEATGRAKTTSEMVHSAAAHLAPHHVPPTFGTKFPSGQAGLPRVALHLPVRVS